MGQLVTGTKLLTHNPRDRPDLLTYLTYDP